jgi:hypothetical protein
MSVINGSVGVIRLYLTANGSYALLLARTVNTPLALCEA